MKTCLIFSTILLGLSYTTGSNAQGETGVYVNGQELSLSELVTLQQQIGPIAPGFYNYDSNSGCWVELSTGASGCLGFQFTHAPEQPPL